MSLSVSKRSPYSSEQTFQVNNTGHHKIPYLVSHNDENYRPFKNEYWSKVKYDILLGVSKLNVLCLY
jgi:hypothetical protein